MLDVYSRIELNHPSKQWYLRAMVPENGEVEMEVKLEVKMEVEMKVQMDALILPSAYTWALRVHV